MKLLIVESPAKAKTINKYLGTNYKVISSYGHVRALPSEKGAVDPNTDFTMRYEISEKSTKHVEEIVKQVKKSDTIYLATDPDREGEAISWHILEILKKKQAISQVAKVKRVVFNEITKKAILIAIEKARDIDMHLVQAQQTRQALDYLVGFTLSPVLWRKLPGSKSAGRVQSVALRIICEREFEIEQFKTQEYWTISADFSKITKEVFQAELVNFAGQKLGKFSIQNEELANSTVEQIKPLSFNVIKIEKKQTKRNPSPPFTTATLIQEASRKFGFSARRTAQVAQKLYEGISIKGEMIGLITYMRTDSVNISQEAARDAAELISSLYGKNYLPKTPNIYKTKTKNAQEAHEAIRPTDVKLLPKDIEEFLEPDQFKLYELVWKRLVASQMSSAILDIVVASIASANQEAIFRANGSTLIFPGYYKVYREGLDDQEEESYDKILPILDNKEKLDLIDSEAKQHFTQPPPRYTEASLVKKMEELGIGRPSTYPTIISILQTRTYVTLVKRRFIPEPKGRLVNAFLMNFFTKYVEYDFTANLENKLDEIAAGKQLWKTVLHDFWYPFKEKTDNALVIKTGDILENIENTMFDYIFRDYIVEGEGENKIICCPTCKEGKLELKNGKFGCFIGCSSYPACNYVKQLNNPSLSDNSDNSNSSEDTENKVELPRILGTDPETNMEISLKKGPYGIYIQLGEGKTAKKVGLQKNLSLENLNLAYAINLLKLPRIVGIHPETQKVIKSGFGRYGPYIEYDSKYTALKYAKLDPMTITLEEAIEIIANAPKKQVKSKKFTKIIRKKKV